MSEIHLVRRLCSVALATLVVGLLLVAATGGATVEAATQPAQAKPKPKPAKAQGHDDGGEPGAREVRSPAPRLVVSDGVEGKLTVIDLRQGAPLASFWTPQPSSLVTAGDGRIVFATQSGAHLVNILDAGAWTLDHGDHAHHWVRAPRLLPIALPGSTPIHAVPHGDYFASFSDGFGSAAVLDVKALKAGKVNIRTITTSNPHHGVIVPFRGGFLASYADAPNASPAGATVRDNRGRVVQRVAQCPGLHGEYADDAYAIFACADGFLLFRASGTNIRPVKVPLPTGVPRSGTLIGAHGLPYVIGNRGPNGFSRITIANGAVTPLSDLPAARAAFALDPRSGNVLAVTPDGKVHLVDARAGRLVASVDAVTPFDMEGGFSVPRPKIVVGTERRAYVSDPAAGRVVELATNELRVTRTINVAGRPNNLALAGQS